MSKLTLSDVLTADPDFDNFCAAKVESLSPTGYRLISRNGILSLQGYFRWEQGSMGGGEWRDIPTVFENIDSEDYL